jgi:23S rRNA-/tRNA-specific pseudouridylate synthase
MTQDPSPIRLLTEDELYRVIIKPTQIHSAALTQFDNSIASWIRTLYPEQAHIGEGDCGLAHRLDWETSGLLVSAKNPTAWNHLRELFSKNLVIKWYIALTEGAMSDKQICSASIGSRYRHSKKVSVLSNFSAEISPSRGNFRTLQPAESTFFPLQKITLPSAIDSDTYTNQELSIAAILLGTGRRHQIRAHASFIGHPLVGDTLYGSTTQLPQSAHRPFLLHSLAISFIGLDEKRRSYLSLDYLPNEIAEIVKKKWPAIEHESIKLFSIDKEPRTNGPIF